MKIKPCPFCECEMESFGYTIDRLSGSIVNQVRHPLLDNGCPLVMLVFRVKGWNHRPLIDKAITERTEQCAKIAEGVYQESIDVNERCEYAGRIMREIRALNHENKS